MTSATTEEKTVKNDAQKRLRDAEKSFEKMQEELRPFVRQRRVVRHSSAGRWIETSSLELVDA